MTEAERLRDRIAELERFNMQDRNTLQIPGFEEEEYSQAHQRIDARNAELKALRQKLESLPK